MYKCYILFHWEVFMIRFHKNRTTGILISAGVFTAVCFSCAAAPKEVGAGMLDQQVSAAAQVPCCDTSVAVLVPMGSGCTGFNEAVAKKIQEAQEMERCRADAELLASIIFCEAGNQSFEGQVAVGAVILNRVESSKFPNTIYGVIYQPYAFTCVADGQINMEPNQTAYNAARDALNGWDPTYGCLYYYNPSTATSSWIWSRQIVVTIGKHNFAL